MKSQIILTPFFLGKAKPILKDLMEKDWILNDPALSPTDASSCIREVHESIKKETGKVLQQNKRPVSIAGDCLTAISILSALQEHGVDPFVLWLDAHGDFNTEEITISGFLAGMSLAKITGRGDQQLVQDIFMANLPDDDVLLADARDLDPAEKKLIESSGIHWISDINAIRDFNFNGRPIYIHFDMDIIDSRYVPAMLYPVPGGPSPDDLTGLFQFLSATQHICAVSVTPWEQSLDTDDRTKEICMRLIGELL